MHREIVKRRMGLLLSICLFAICFIWGCTKIEPGIGTEATQPSNEASIATGESVQGDPTVSTNSLIPTDNSVSTISTTATETTEATVSTETTTTESTKTTEPIKDSDPTMITETTEPTSPAETEATDPVETTPTETQEIVPDETEEKEQVYTITYNNLFGTTHDNPAAYTEATAADIILTPPTERSGYTFDGWYIGDTKVETLAACNGDLSLTAKWKEKSTGGAIELPDVEC